MNRASKFSRFEAFDKQLRDINTDLDNLLGYYNDRSLSSYQQLDSPQMQAHGAGDRDQERGEGVKL